MVKHGRRHRGRAVGHPARYGLPGPPGTGGALWKKEHVIKRFPGVLESECCPAGESCQDVGEKFPLAEGSCQVPGDDFSPA